MAEEKEALNRIAAWLEHKDVTLHLKDSGTFSSSSTIGTTTFTASIGIVFSIDCGINACLMTC
jgi:hypothetical protein